MITGRSALRRLTSCSRPSPSMPGMLMSDSARAQTVESARLDWIANSSRLPERGDSVNVADEQDALFVDAWIPQTIRWWVARKFCPDLIELLGNALAAGLPFALFTLDRAFELNPVIGVIGIDDQDRDLGVYLIQMPARVGLRLAFTQVRCNQRPEVAYPAPNGLLGVNTPPFCPHTFAL